MGGRAPRNRRMPAIPGVEIVRELGRGGMGVVYVGRQPALERDVAVKVLEVTYSTADSRERFIREAKSAASLTHPGIVTIHDTGVSRNGIPYILMTLLPGGSLRGRLDAGPPLHPDEVARVGIQMADALAHAHAREVIHRDVKPSNILLDAEGNAYLADFGIAQIAGATRLTTQQVQLGTTEYMAPELAVGKPASPASDVYALAVTLYEALAGRPPYVGEDPQLVLYQHRFEELPPLPAEVPESLAAVVTRALLKDPEARWQSAAEMAAALRECLSTLTSDETLPTAVAAPGSRAGTTVIVRRREHAKPAAKGPPPPTVRSRIRGRIAALAALLAALRTRIPRSVALGAAAVILLALIATIAVLNVGRLSGPAPTRYAFAPEQYGSGLEVRRTWVLTPGKVPVLTVQLEVANTTKHAVSGTVDETITKEVATSVNDVRFDVAPATVVNPDHVVRFAIGKLAAGKSTTISYHVTLRNGVPAGGLTALAQREGRAQAAWLNNCAQPVAARLPAASGPPTAALWLLALAVVAALLLVVLRLAVRIYRSPPLVRWFTLALVAVVGLQLTTVTTARADYINGTYYSGMSASFAPNPGPNGATTESVSYTLKNPGPGYCFSNTVAAYDGNGAQLWTYGASLDCPGQTRSFSRSFTVSCCGTHQITTYILAQNAMANPNLYNGYVVRDLSTCGTASPPQGVSASAGVGSASVSWGAPANGGCGVTSYTVTAQPGGANRTVGGTGASFSGLANGTSYSFTVVANNAAGGSGGATSNTVTTPNVPGPPSGVSAAAGTNSATVSWGPPGSDGGSVIKGYIVTGDPGGQASSVGPGTLSTTFTGLTAGTGYTFTVVATNAVGSGPGASSSATPTAPPTQAPSQTPTPNGGSGTTSTTPAPAPAPTPTESAPTGTPTPTATGTQSPEPQPSPTCPA